MTLEEIETRLTALEESVQDLMREREAESPSAPAVNCADEFIEGTEYLVVLHPLPPKSVVRVRGTIREVRRGREDLGLSSAEWAALDLGENDEQ